MVLKYSQTGTVVCMKEHNSVPGTAPEDYGYSPENTQAGTPTYDAGQSMTKQSYANAQPGSLPQVTREALSHQPGAHLVNAIEIHGLTKAFGMTVAVNRINLSIPTGSFYGLVGRNGAGKTTTISMVSGMLQPTEGVALIKGTDMWQNPLEAKKHLGVLPDGVHLFDKLTGEQLITYSGYLHGLERDTVAERTKDQIGRASCRERVLRLV